MDRKPDKSLGVPAEAATEKHMNFLETENSSNNDSSSRSGQENSRRDDWQRGLEEGRRENEKQQGNG